MGYTSLFSLQETMEAEETCVDSVTVMNTNNHCLFWFEAHLYICFDDVFQWLQASAWCIKPIFVILKWFYISVFLFYFKKKDRVLLYIPGCSGSLETFLPQLPKWCVTGVSHHASLLFLLFYMQSFFLQLYS